MRWFKAAPSAPHSPASPASPGGRRGQIAQAALALLADQPLERLTTREIAAAVGISQPALFRHFASREEILLAVVEQVRGDLEAAVLGLLSAGPGAAPAPLAQCAGLAQALIAYVQRHPGVPRLLFADLALDLPRLRLAVAALVSMPRALVAERVAEAQRQGAARPDADAEAAAALFVALLQGLFLQGALGQVAREQLPARLDAQLALWHAALQPPAALQPTAAPQPAAWAPRPAAPPPPPAPPIPPIPPQLRLLDVRPILAGGVDPLAAILARLGELPPGSRLVVAAPFRPRPLEALLASRGHAVQACGGEAGAWSVTIDAVDAVPLLDLRDLEPPEPLERLVALGRRLGAGEVAMAQLPRAPRWLAPQLQAIGCAAEVVELADGTALVAVQRAA